LITDQPGPYVVSLTKTIPIEDQIEVYAALNGAKVKITDSNGFSESLIEKSPGNFYTQDIQGSAGTSYFVTITTDDGNVYESSVEKMLPVSDFSLQTKFIMNTDSLDQNIDTVTHPGGSYVSSANGFNVTLKTDFLPQQEGRVWWRGIGTWHILTYPGSQVEPKGIKDPPDCAGILTGVCTCCDCWITEYNEAPLIADNIITSSVDNMKIWFIPANRRTLYDRYHLVIEQMSLSAAVYEFWKSVKIQRSNSSNLFQVPPPKTTGNIRVLSPNALPAIGYFAASASKSHTLYITKKDVPYLIWDIDFIKRSCLDTYSYDPDLKHITNKRPSFW